MMSDVLSDQEKWWATLPNVNDKVKLMGADIKAGVLSENFWKVLNMALCIVKPIYKMI